MDTSLKDSLSTALLQSMEALSEKAASNTDATLTVEAKIVEVVDEGKGIYKVQYLGNTFEATAAHTEIIYDIDEMVYVIVPGGNFDNNKIILSPVSPETTTYASTQDGNSYVTLGDNLFASVADVELCTFRPHGAEPCSVDTTGFAQLISAALKDSRVLNFTCRVKTNIEKSRRVKGNYGLILEIPVIQENTAKFYNFTLDINNLSGDPYNYAEYALQNCYFELPADMEYDASRNPIISSFITDFVGDYSSTALADIWIKDIKLLFAFVLGEEDLTGYYMVLTASEGNSFLVTRTQDTKTITPTVYLNGRVTKLTNFDCYWFRENCLVDTESDKFNRLGGLGWEILNERTNLEIEEGGKETYQYATNVYQLKVNQADIHSATRYKCVLVKSDNVITQIITIRNLASTTELNLFSKTGSNTYVENVGKVKLVIRCYEAGITDVDDPVANVSYAWQRFDKFGNYIDNDFYTITRLNDKVLIDGKKYYETEITYDVNEIDESNTVYCTAYIETTINGKVNQVIAGTSSIQLLTTPEAVYTIKVENGDKLYKYDADGDSPRIADYDGPLSSAIKNIPPISLTLFKPDGTEFTEDEYSVTTIEWLIPVDSMYKLTSAQKTDPASNPGYYTIKGSYNNYKTLSYDIANSYNVKKLDNTILIRAYFKSNMATNVANIRFLKDGEAGTNGSKYSAIVTYNGYGYGERAANGKMNKLQLIYVVDQALWYKYNPATGELVQLSYGGNIANLGVDTYADGEKIPNSTIEWSIFDSEYDYDRIRVPFRIFSSILTLKDIGDYYSQWIDAEDNYSAIVQARVRAKKNGIDDGQTSSEEYVYAYYPIEITRVEKASYLKGLLPTLDGGYYKVLYASDGTNPQYDNSNNFFVANGLTNENAGDLYEYTWSTSGNLVPHPDDEDKSCRIVPATKFDNGASKNYVKIGLAAAEGASTTLAQRIAKLQAELTYQNNRLNYYNDMQSALDILHSFNYNNYIERLESAIDFFNIKTNLVRLDKNIITSLTALLSKVDVYYETDQSEKMIRLRAELIDRINTFNNLLNFSCELGINLSAMELIKAVAPYSLLMTNINVTSEDSAYYVSLRDSVLRYNNQIEVIYKNYYDQLDNNFRSLELVVNGVVTDLQNYVNDSRWGVLSSSAYGIDEQGYLFSAVSVNLKTYINNLSDDENYSYDKIINNILKPINILIKQFIDIDYNSVIIKITDDIANISAKLNEYRNLTLPDSATAIIHTKPVLMLFNRYEMSNINGWDGNKTAVEDGYILSPQVGAGKKVNGLFSGIVIGVKQTGVKSTVDQRIGMFGYSEGRQSLFLNAKDGSAIFGLSGCGQITIDPLANKGLIYSSNYWKEYNSSDGKPVSYSDSNKKGEGMLIDLTTPEIRFGSGNFVVTSEGHVTAKGGGSIGGWKIGDTELYSNKTKAEGRITLDSASYGKIYSHNHSSFDSVLTGFYLSYEGLSIGAKARIDKDGKATFSDITATGGKIGGWTLDSTKLSSNGITINSTGSISGDGYGGGSWSINRGSATFNKLTINGGSINVSGNAVIYENGSAVFNSITCTGTINATGGYLGNTSNSLGGGGITFNAGSISLGTAAKGGAGISYGNGVCKIAGDIYANNGYFSGEIQSIKGKIAGWTIGSTALSNGHGASISSNGNCSFNHIDCSTISVGEPSYIGNVGQAIYDLENAIENLGDIDKKIEEEVSAQISGKLSNCVKYGQYKSCYINRSMDSIIIYQ